MVFHAPRTIKRQLTRRDWLGARRISSSPLNRRPFATQGGRVTIASLAELDALPRLGWVQAATPVTALPSIAEELGLEFFGVKRDDLLEPLHGGAKPRKLDYLLAAQPFRDAEVWSSVGGIGSGSLVAITGAAARLGRRLEAHMFWTTVSEGVVENLAFTASGPTRIHFYPSRVALALQSPAMLGAAPARGRAIVPAGATSATGLLGMVRAGVEVADQIRAGELPTPDRVYVPLGSGGVAAGLSVGLALGGVSTTVAAIAVVERALSMGARIASLQRAALAELARAGLAPPAPVPIAIDHAHLGRGYAQPTKASLEACARFAPLGLTLEPVYTGKAMAALRGDARKLGLRRVLFWQTARRGPIPHAADYADRLPPALARALADPAAFGRRVTRRRVLVAVAATVTGAIVARTSGYGTPPPWPRQALAAWEASVVTAAAEALLAPFATPDELSRVARGVDRCLATMAPEVQREAHGMFALIEHGTLLGGRLPRFTNLAPDARERFLSGLEARGGLFALAYRGLRDLCMFAFYAQESTWPAIGYGGPLRPRGYDPRGPDRWQWASYDELVAPPGTPPRGLVE
jgi:D-cysteine desulfhydrase